MQAHEYLERPTIEEIRELPKFNGLPLDRIRLIRTADDLHFAQREIFNSSHVGFDTESKPNFIAINQELARIFYRLLHNITHFYLRRATLPAMGFRLKSSSQ